MDTLTKHKRTRCRGTEVVEMAIVLPLLLVLVLGAIEYGWIFLHLQEVTNAARQGARMEAVYGAPADAGETAISSLLGGSSWIVGTPSVAPDPDDPELILARIRVRLHHEGSDSGIAIINAPNLIPIPNEWEVVIKMAKEGA